MTAIPRDPNRHVALFGVSSIDGTTPIPWKVNPSTGAALIDSASLYTGLDTRYIQLAGDLGNTTISPQVISTHLTSALPVNQGGTGQISYTDGQLLIGNTTGNTLAVATLTGTANQVAVANGHGTITLSTPQNIDTGAAVQHGTLQLNAGSASAPSLFFTGALTSGLFGAGTNQLGVAVNGTLALQMNSATQWGWHGTAPSSINVITSAITITGSTPSAYMNIQFNYNPTIGGSSTATVLVFEATSTKAISPVGGSFTATTSLNNPTLTPTGIITIPRINPLNTMASGTLTLVGHDFAPGTPGTGTITGGTINIIGSRVSALPANYTGGGATVNFYSLFSSGAAILYNAGAIGANVQAPSAYLHLGAGTATASTAPLKFNSGTNLTTAEVGTIEYDGVQLYNTIDTTSGRGAVPIEQYFHLTAAGGTISTIANYFGTTSNISLVASGYYEIDIYLYYLKTTAGTVTWTLTNSAAPTSQNIFYEMSPVGGITAPPGDANMLQGQIYNDATAAKTVVTASLTTAVNHYAHFKIFLQNGTGTSLKIQATCSAGTITPGINSWWFARRLSPNNIGTFAA